MILPGDTIKSNQKRNSSINLNGYINKNSLFVRFLFIKMMQQTISILLSSILILTKIDIQGILLPDRQTLRGDSRQEDKH